MWQAILDWFKAGFKGFKTPEIDSIQTPTAPVATPVMPAPVVTAPKGNGVLKGIDLSHWETVEDWDKLKPQIDFGYTKLTQGSTFLDPAAKTIVAGFNKIGKPVGVYCVIECGQDVQKQVDFFARCLKSIGPVQCRHAIDFELSPNKSISMATNKAKCMEMVKAFTKTFGHKPLLYFNASDEKEFAFKPEEYAQFDLWLAAYNSKPNPPTPKYIKRVFMWQHTDKQVVAGVGTADHDYLYGSMNELLIVQNAANNTPAAPIQSGDKLPDTSKPTPPMNENGELLSTRDLHFLTVADSLLYRQQAMDVILHWRKKHPGSDPRYRMLVDFSMKDTEKRAFLIDCDQSMVEPHRVSHGAGSDPNKDGYADVFSDKDGSHMSMLGIYRVAETYQGKNGYSCRLDGEDDSNDTARSRAVVIHPADYVSDADGVLHTGDSWGCFAFDPAKSKSIIDRLKDGSPLYAFKGKA